MFPLKQRKLIRGCQAHITAGLGCGLDVVASTGTELYAPFNGTIETYFGTQGGKWSRLTRINGDRVEMAHLSKYLVTSGNVTAGQLIAYTGNTGSVTTGPHLHIQIFRDGKRIDPDAYNWEESVIINPPMGQIEELTAQVKRLQAEVKKLTDMVNDPANGIEALKRTIVERDVLLDSKRAEIIELKKQLALCGVSTLTDEQAATIALFDRLQSAYKELIQ